MTEPIDDLIDKAIENLRQTRKRAKLMSGPVEKWSIPRYIDALGFAMRAMDNVNEALRRQGYSNHPEYERLQASELFYHFMLRLGYLNLNIGSVISALRKLEIPEETVRTAAAAAYLHRELRQAIMEGYGMIPLEPPKRA